MPQLTNAVGEGHDCNGQEGWKGIPCACPVDLGSIHHHETAAEGTGFNSRPSQRGEVRLRLGLQELQLQYYNITAKPQQAAVSCAKSGPNRKGAMQRINRGVAQNNSWCACQCLGETARKKERDGSAADRCSPANNDQGWADGIGWNAGCRQTQRGFRQAHAAGGAELQFSCGPGAWIVCSRRPVTHPAVV